MRAPKRAQPSAAAAPAPTGTPEFDDQGYAWLRIDQGAAQGLRIGDRFRRDDDWRSEGRVSSLDASRAEVLWRTWHADSVEAPALPALGDLLKTPAWQRDERRSEAAARVVDEDAEA